MKLFYTVLTCSMIALFGCNAGKDSGLGDHEGEDSIIVEGPVQWLTFEGTEGPGKGKHIVLISGDEEYRSEEALPQMAKILSSQHGFTCTVLFSQDPEKPGIIDPNYLHNIPGLEHLASADLMYIFTRFRALPDEQMQHIDSYLMQGKPVIAVRTSTHAFNFDSTHVWAHYGNYYKGKKEEWHGGFGKLVLGENWYNHHGHHKQQSTRGVIAPGAESHPVVKGIGPGEIWGSSDVYGIHLPQGPGEQAIVLGQVTNRAGEFDENDRHYGMRSSDREVADNPHGNIKEITNVNDPMIPVAWTKSYRLPGGKEGKSFTATVGVAVDMLTEGTRRMLVNAVYWALDMEVPEKASVELVGDYAPTQFKFEDDAYWDEKNMKVSDQR